MRAFNYLLVVAAVAGLIFGSSWVAQAIWQEGIDNAKRASQQTQPTVTTRVRAAESAEPDRLSSPWERAVLVASGALVVASVVSPVIGGLTGRRRHRVRWHSKTVGRK